MWAVTAKNLSQIVRRCCKGYCHAIIGCVTDIQNLSHQQVWRRTIDPVRHLELGYVGEVIDPIKKGYRDKLNVDEIKRHGIRRQQTCADVVRRIIHAIKISTVICKMPDDCSPPSATFHHRAGHKVRHAGPNHDKQFAATVDGIASDRALKCIMGLGCGPSIDKLLLDKGLKYGLSNSLRDSKKDVFRQRVTNKKSTSHDAFEEISGARSKVFGVFQSDRIIKDVMRNKFRRTEMLGKHSRSMARKLDSKQPRDPSMRIAGSKQQKEPDRPEAEDDRRKGMENKKCVPYAMLHCFILLELFKNCFKFPELLISNYNNMANNVEHCRAALKSCPPGDFRQSRFLNSLALGLRKRFKQRGVVSDLDEAIELYRAALALSPPGHHNRPSSLNVLANSLRDRFWERGFLYNLYEAIELHRAALAVCPLGYSDQSMSLNNLAISLHDRFQQRGVLSDLHEAIELHRAALALRPPGHSHRSIYLNNLAITLHDRFVQQGVLSDLQEAIKLHRAALALYPAGDSDRSMSLNNLAVSLHHRFEQRGVLSDLDESIELHRAALALRSPVHSDRYMSLNNLASSLRDSNGASYLTWMRSLSSIELHWRSTLLAIPVNPHLSHNLAISLRDRFRQWSIMSDLDESIELHRAALALFPPAHSDRPLSLNNLASSLGDKFRKRGVLSDLDESIELRWRSVPLAIIIDPHLSTTLPVAFETGSTSGASCLTLKLPFSSIELRWRSKPNLANSLRYRFHHQGLSSDLDEAFRLYLQLSQVSHAVSRSDLNAAKSWTTFAEQVNHDSALVAYETTLKFLDQHVAALSFSSHHFDVVKEATSSLATDAFSCSVRQGALTTAVELVEQGRAVFWTHLARFRTPLDELSASGDTGKALAEKFKQLSFRLRNVLDSSTEDQSPPIRQLTMEWNDALFRIRMLPDFSRFLLPPRFSELQKAAEDGPVIIVNASQYSCDALIILSAQAQKQAMTMSILIYHRVLKMQDSSR
ncbi:hypothetical protein DFH29DRAFT_1065322 [Suillus ampliporus]|nr:hypothetical protein DFH29DRAFT_1065322 [Suillus ampliporus]